MGRVGSMRRGEGARGSDSRSLNFGMKDVQNNTALARGFSGSDMQNRWLSRRIATAFSFLFFFSSLFLI